MVLRIIEWVISAFSLLLFSKDFHLLPLFGYLFPAAQAGKRGRFRDNAFNCLS